ncbi:MAG TPA: beta-propeller domain-containing protein, partial [Nitrososphaerales archaeon]|nr:beta-propeller domain-containing protein [Nitrososphaerales archaeon]
MQSGSKVGRGNKANAAFFLVVLAVSAAFAVYSLTPAHKTQQGTPLGPAVQATSQGLSSFQSYSELQAFVAANAKSAQAYNNYGGARFIGGPEVFNGDFGGIAAGVAGPAEQGAVSAPSASPSNPSFSGTNVQVQGVDEPDLVKTDGAHLFVATNGTSNSAPSGSVSIMNAYPPTSASILSTIRLPGAQVLGIEVAQNRLLVIDQRYSNTAFIGLILYDTSNLSSPVLMNNETIAGNFVAARLVQGYVYAIVQQPSYRFIPQGNATGVMPSVTANGKTGDLPPTSVYYSPVITQIGEYTMIVSVGMVSGTENTLSVLTGPSSTVYVSTSNIYLVYSN